MGEFLILRGAWDGASIALASVASLGIALAAVYALRLFILGVHNRVGPHAEPQEASKPQLALLAVPVVLILALAFHPQQTLRAADLSATQSVLPAAAAVDPAAATAMAAEAARTRDCSGWSCFQSPAAKAAAGGATADATDAAAGQDVAIDPNTGQPVEPEGAAAGQDGAVTDELTREGDDEITTTEDATTTEGAGR